MKYSLIAFFALFSLGAIGADGKTYLPDENHLPGYRSPALQKQAQEERPQGEVRHIKKFEHRKGSKVGANPEAIDLDRKETKHD